jgi:hypothetical protein
MSVLSLEWYQSGNTYARIDGTIVVDMMVAPSPYVSLASSFAGFFTNTMNYIISHKIYIEIVGNRMSSVGTGALGIPDYISATSGFKPISSDDISLTYIGTLHTSTGISYDKLSTYASELVTYLKTKNIKTVSDLTSSTGTSEIKSFFSLSDDFDTMLPVWAITLKVSTSQLSALKSCIVSALETAGITAGTMNTTDAMLVVKRYFPPTSNDVIQLAPVLANALGVDANIITENCTHITDVLSSKNIAMKDVLTSTGLSAVNYAIGPFKVAAVSTEVQAAATQTEAAASTEVAASTEEVYTASTEAQATHGVPLWLGIGAIVAVLALLLIMVVAGGRRK